jgi:NAD(P)-dependent dehydrogenase (short-subunit alcohol dehydrogenase family)
MTGFTEADVPDQSGKCIIVTGANAGLGFEAARALAAKGARVLLACRSKDKAEAAMAQIGRETPGADLGFLPLDQADLASVRAAAELAGKEARIDVLLNNAGVMFPPLTRTAEGFELQFGVNHLGCFALTSLLLPKLAQTPGARVVITASLAHTRGNLQWDDLNAEAGYSRTARYSDSKLANMLFLLQLDRRLRAAGSSVTAAGCHPGVAATELMRHSGPFRIATPLFGLFLNTAAKGAWPALQAACAGDVQGGEYFGPQGMGGMRGASGRAVRTSTAQDTELSRRLWDVSVQMTGIDPGLPAA